MWTPGRADDGEAALLVLFPGWPRRHGSHGSGICHSCHRLHCAYRPPPCRSGRPTSAFFFGPCFFPHRASRDSCCTCISISAEETDGCGQRLPVLRSPARPFLGLGAKLLTGLAPGSHQPCLPPAGYVSPLHLLIIKERAGPLSLEKYLGCLHAIL